jgi:hypothetical protein
MKEYYASVGQKYGSSVGSLAAVIWKLPRNSDGSIIANYENADLCSKPGQTSKVTGSTTDNATGTQLKNSSPPTILPVKEQLPGYEM